MTYQEYSFTEALALFYLSALQPHEPILSSPLCGLGFIAVSPIQLSGSSMTLTQWTRFAIFQPLFYSKWINPSSCRLLFSHSKPPDEDLKSMLCTPSWSVKSLFESTSPSQEPPITQKQLHHLLRLSALPLPTSTMQEQRMIADLQSQLQFVQAIQSVDTANIEPLQSIRDETKEAEIGRKVTIATLHKAFDKEEVVGRRGRIRTKRQTPTPTGEGLKEWDPLAQAPNKQGRFIVVDTAKD